MSVAAVFNMIFVSDIKIRRYYYRPTKVYRSEYKNWATNKHHSFNGSMENTQKLLKVQKLKEGRSLLLSIVWISH